MRLHHLSVFRAYPETKVFMKGCAFDKDGKVIDIDLDYLHKVNEEVNYEVEIKEIRKKRDKLLKDSDWVCLPDVGITEEEKEYRQALRDITEGFTSYLDIKWPTPPPRLSK